MKADLLMRTAIFVFLLLTPISSNSQYTQKEIALTFDDEIRSNLFFGDNGILATLKKNNARATFFVLGYQVQLSPGLFKMLAENDYEIENHTWGHENLLKLKKKGINVAMNTIERTSSAIEHAIGKRPRFFRPPYWAIDRELKNDITLQGYHVVTIDNPDINSLDYDDNVQHRPATVLINRVLGNIQKRESQNIYRHVLVFHETPQTRDALIEILPELRKQGYHFVTLEEFFKQKSAFLGSSAVYATDLPLLEKSPVRALYLSLDDITNEKKIAELEYILSTTDANAIVIDYKVDQPVSEKLIRELVERFKVKNIYLIARIVVMQDSYLARMHPEVALHRLDNSFWWSGRKSWHRYWVDPASPMVLLYTIGIARQAIDFGFDEINFDYIRFPTDGALREIIYPVFNAQTMSKSVVMSRFFKELTSALKKHIPRVKLSIDLFGEVAVYGEEKNIGQELISAGKYFDILCPMIYPSHYRCGEFGFRDPTAHPYEVYRATLFSGKQFLEKYQIKVTLRPWAQAFSIQNIYGCGPYITYGVHEVRSEIQAGVDIDVPSFMLWNASSKYSSRYFLPKK